MMSRGSYDDNAGISPRRLPDLVTPQWLHARACEFRVEASSIVRDEKLHALCEGAIHRHDMHRELKNDRTLIASYFAEVRISSRLLELDQVTTRAAA